jgi:uncharacterized flavoprotein (TIGR03862 family)
VRRALVVGAGPAGLMAAETLARGGLRVEVMDAAPSPARKFLLAGRGGLNLTHAEPIESFLDRYGAAREQLAPAIRAFPPEALREWSAGLGEPTFVGSSGRVFPESFKATRLARAWLKRLGELGVAYSPRSRFVGFEGDAMRFATPEGERGVRADVYLLALGGASWPRLGGDGSWVDALVAAGVDVAPLEPANMGLMVDWSAPFRERFAGSPIKAARWSLAGLSSRAEAVVTAAGLEGGAIYALSCAAREALQGQGGAGLHVDLKPDLDETTLAAKLARNPRASRSTRLAKAGLSPVAIGLLREAGDLPADVAGLAARVKDCRLKFAGVAGLARAISSAGGVRWSALDAHYMLKAKPGVFVAGEMIDWEAPTGGYLLQASFSTGVAAGRGALGWLGGK